MEVAQDNIRTLSMDHHGIVAAICKDLKIAEKINDRIKTGDKRRILSTGKSVVAMILNGLGFTNRRLYLTHQFFETKPTEILFDEDITASDITDHALGRALDEIAEYGSSKLFGEIAFEVAIENNLLGSLNHLDTTSISVNGEYPQDEIKKKENGESEVIHITHGHSKDYRPDLKQVVLSLVVNGPSAIPLFMEPLDGNSSDKTSFQETIKKVSAFKKQINFEQDFKWVADSALYSKEKLLANNDYLWLTRVPETITEAKNIILKSSEEIQWKQLENGYKIAPFTSNYGDIEQRWLLVYSEQAYNREKRTLEKNLIKKDEAIKNTLWRLGNETFDCEKDAQSALQKTEKKNNLYDIESKVVPIMKYAKKGKPKPGDEKIIFGYKIESSFERNQNEVNKLLTSKGRFILTTNDLNEKKFPNENILNEYKEQQNVEGGFRFLKDPWFMVDSIFLKSPKRIEALMMVMTLCLMVYNISQYKLRTALKEKDETLPNQINKEVQNPTMRWIFQIMEGINIIQFFENEIEKPIKELITNINDLRKRIICLFGDTARVMYGLIKKCAVEIA
jgi:transposase